MELIKKEKRILKMADLRYAIKMTDGKVTNLGTYCKWKELRDCGRLQVKMTVYKFEQCDKTWWMLEDTLGRVASNAQEDYNEIKSFLKDKGYKPEKRWYIEDYGMTEETWNEWNGNSEEE